MEVGTPPIRAKPGPNVKSLLKKRVRKKGAVFAKPRKTRDFAVARVYFL
jgi:hypothetical protein